MTAGNGRLPVVKLIHVGWYAPDAPAGRRLSEDNGWRPPGAIPVYVQAEGRG